VFYLEVSTVSSSAEIQPAKVRLDIRNSGREYKLVNSICHFKYVCFHSFTLICFSTHSIIVMCMIIFFKYLFYFSLKQSESCGHNKLVAAAGFRVFCSKLDPRFRGVLLFKEPLAPQIHTVGWVKGDGVMCNLLMHEPWL